MENIQANLSRLERAFGYDGFSIKKWAATESGRLGVLAEHLTAVNYDTGKKKTAFYFEGTPYERGYLMGLLAETAVSDMAVNFVDNIVFDFLGLDFLNSVPFLKDIIVDIIHDLSAGTWASQPQHIHEEASGILAGCRKSNPGTKVTDARIGILNVGIDVLCALIYTGHLKNHAPYITPKDIHLAMMCNAFSVFGEAARGEHYFARDFMFSTGGVFQNNVAHIINLPDSSEKDEEKYPYVSLAAPGIIGAFSVMNLRGVAGGLDMSPAANCDTGNVGFNSMLLLRECVMKGGSAKDAAKVIENAGRGVTWNYVLSDGSTDTACTVEAGASWPQVDFLAYPPKELLPYLPDAVYLKSNSPVPYSNGVMVRWCNGVFPEEYYGFNGGLWEYYKANRDKNIKLYPDAFMPWGFINRKPEEKNCPSGFYFAPRRTGKDVIVTTNHYLMPEMRLCAMDPWCSQVVHGKINDIQWRYDELNSEILEALSKNGYISYEDAKKLADFLAPYGRFPLYYKNNPRSRDGKAIRIDGCVSLFDLKKRSVESHFGYYSDKWIRTTLPAYIV